MNNAVPFDSFTQRYFSQNPQVYKPRSVFDRSHSVLDTYDFDTLNPCFIDEILPGDTLSLDASVFVRLSQAQKVPLLDNAYMDFFFFFVPSRLVWENWEKFNGAQDNPGDSTDFTVPQITVPWTVGSIGDKFGIPITTFAAYPVNALPFRCYALIWNEWFRDQDLQDSLDFPTGNTGDTAFGYTLKKRAKVHDYFTSMRPWPQKAPDVLIPVSMQSAPLPVSSSNAGIVMRGVTTNVDHNFMIENGTNKTYVDSNGAVTPEQAKFGSTTGLQVDADDLEDALVVGTINDLRLAFQMQQLFEMDARGGTRYVELLYSTWGVVSPDFRLQRPEYIGGGHIRFNSHPVPQTSPTDGDSAQGQLAAFGTASNAGSRIGFSKSFVEHGYVIGLCAARGEITYQQSLNRLWTRQTRYEFHQPALENIGEQAVLGKELCADTDPSVPDGYLEEPIGWQERYAEYKYKPNEVRGEFRSTYATPLDMYHLAEEFDPEDPPRLDDEFIQSNTPIDRNLPITTNSPIYFNAYYKMKHSRVMQTRPVPLSLQRL